MTSHLSIFTRGSITCRGAVFMRWPTMCTGPYNYTGSIMDASSFAPGFEKPTWPSGFLQGRHGSFFEWHNQWYFSYCDISQTGNRYFRDTFISYVHYKKNGEMALVRVDGIGVGEYDANQKHRS